MHSRCCWNCHKITSPPKIAKSEVTSFILKGSTGSVPRAAWLDFAERLRTWNKSLKWSRERSSFFSGGLWEAIRSITRRYIYIFHSFVPVPCARHATLVPVGVASLCCSGGSVAGVPGRSREPVVRTPARNSQPHRAQGAVQLAQAGQGVHLPAAGPREGLFTQGAPELRVHRYRSRCAPPQASLPDSRLTWRAFKWMGVVYNFNSD